VVTLGPNRGRPSGYQGLQQHLRGAQVDGEWRFKRSRVMARMSSGDSMKAFGTGMPIGAMR
jgi:hypothetical protein